MVEIKNEFSAFRGGFTMIEGDVLLESETVLTSGILRWVSCFLEVIVELKYSIFFKV